MASTLRSQSTGLFPSNSIAAAAAQSRDLLLQCTNIPTLMRLEWAENRLAEFKLWAATTGALAGGAASLDARLITEADTKDLVTGLLVLLTQCLVKCRKFALPSAEDTEEVTEELDDVNTAPEDNDEWWANDVQGMDSAQMLDAAEDIPRGFSPWSDDTSSHPGSDSRSVAEDTSPLLEAEAEVEQIINHLARVALAIRKSGTTSRLHKADRTFDPSNHQKLRQHLELIVLARGREDGSSDYLIDREALTAIQERLILANLRRRNRYRYAKKHADKLAIDSTSTNDAGAKSTAVDVWTLRQNGSAIRAPATAQIAESKSEQSPGQGKARLPHRNLVMTATSASGVAQAIEAVPERTLTPSRVAKTNITTTAAKVLYPKPPQSKILKYFKCPCCFQTLPDMYREKTLWKKHLMADICPYICILDECPTPETLYVTRHEWAGHIEKTHRQCWQCPACSVPGRPPVIFPSVEIFLHHLRETHSQSISKEQYSTIVTEAASTIPPGICRCPLCDSTGPADSPGLLDHIAEHLHNFSLRSLPWPDDGSEDNEARDPGDPYFNADDYFDQESGNDSVQDVSVDSDRDSDDLPSLSANSSHDGSVHDLPMEASPDDNEDPTMEASSDESDDLPMEYSLDDNEYLTMEAWSDESDDLPMEASSDDNEDLTMEASPDDSEEKQRMDRMRRWLSPPDFSSTLFEAEAGRDERNAAWFLKSPMFTDWKSGEQRRLFFHGPAGTGKTLFSRTLFHHLQELGQGPVLAFFFDLQDVEKQDFESLIRSIAWQLYQTPRSSYILRSLYETCDDGMRQPEIGQLSNTVESMFHSSTDGEGFVIIDALDECTTRIQVLSWLESFASNRRSQGMRLMVTGRPDTTVLERVPDIFGADNCVTLGRNAGDLTVARSYVDARLRQDLDFTTKPIPQSLLDAIRLRVGEEAGSRFRWAVCQMDALARCSSPDDIQNTLEDLPSTLDETYRRLLQNIPANHKVDGLRLLQFLLWTEEPLTLSEANDILATRIDIDPPQFNVHDRLDDEYQLLYYCPGLLSLEPTDSHTEVPKRIWLSHFTIVEFLKNERQFERNSAIISIVRTALAYIKDVNIDNSLRDVSAHFALAERAAKVVLVFARDAEADDNVLSEISSFLLDPVVLDRLCRLSQISAEDNRVSPLFVACKLGLLRVTKRLLEDGVDVNEGSGTQISSLFVASQEGHSEVVKLLLERGADVHAGDGTPWAPLLAASENGYLDVVRLLLNAGADPNAKSDVSADTALQMASEYGYLDVVRLLLNAGADPNASDVSTGTALQMASANGYVDVVRLLLNYAADPNAKSDVYDTALYAASKNGYQDIAELLLDNDADFNASNSGCITVASSRGHSALVELLWNAGARVTDHALYAASRNGHVEVVKLLLDLNPQHLNQQPYFDNHAVQAALEEGHNGVVEILRSHILCQGVLAGDHDTVKTLLDEGLSPNGRSSLGTPLKIAAEHKHIRIVKLLLKRGADVRIADDGSDLVSYYVTVGRAESTKEILKLLREYRSRG